MTPCIHREGDTITVWCDPATASVLPMLARLGAQVEGERAVCVYRQRGDQTPEFFDKAVEVVAWELAFTMQGLLRSPFAPANGGAS